MMIRNFEPGVPDKYLFIKNLKEFQKSTRMMNSFGRPFQGDNQGTTRSIPLKAPIFLAERCNRMGILSPRMLIFRQL